MIIFRKANAHDLMPVFEIYMSKDVNPYMSFEIFKNPNDFKPLFNSFVSSDELYVLEVNKKIVAVRRLILGIGPYRHTAHYASFAVHPEHRGKGYGKLMYKKFDELIDSNKDIKRIELSQEADNKAALALATKHQFKVEYILPDWMKRGTGIKNKKWYIGERFFCKILHTLPIKKPVNPAYSLNLSNYKDLPLNEPDKNDTENILSLIKTAPDISIWHYWIAENKAHTKIQQAIKENKLIVYKNNKNQLIAAAYFSNHTSTRCKHVVELVGIYTDKKLTEIETCNFLKNLIVNLSKKYKKIEARVVIKNTDLLRHLSSIGFIFRGVKTSSYIASNGDTHDEQILDFSLFGASDVTKYVDISITDQYLKLRLNQWLETLRTQLKALSEKMQLNPYATIIIENYIYQVVKYGNVQDKCTKDWLIKCFKMLPESIQDDIATLMKYCSFINDQPKLQHPPPVISK